MRAVSVLWTALAAGFLTFGGASPGHAINVTYPLIDGMRVALVSWADSKGLTRTVALKLQGYGNPGNGGYAVQATFQAVANGVTTTVVAKAPAGEGFGYFVSHERYRRFADGSEASIAAKIFGKNDSPLGRGFPVSMREIDGGANRKVAAFSLYYPRYGTAAASSFNAGTGKDDPPLGTSAGLFRQYSLPVTISWFFQDGKDHPRIRTRVGLDLLPGADRASFDLRGPYGKLDFDEGANPIATAMWGDRYHFSSQGSPLTRNATWLWNQSNSAARYSALIAGGNEMGLVEPRPYASSALNDGYSLARGKASSNYNGGAGCPYQQQKLPCDYEWPYQSAQYELPYNNPNGATTSEKIAWGSTSYYGMSLNSTYDGVASTPFSGFPATRALTYDVCLVLGRTIAGGLAKSVAIGGGDYSCASGD